MTFMTNTVTVLEQMCLTAIFGKEKRVPVIAGLLSFGFVWFGLASFLFFFGGIYASIPSF